METYKYLGVIFHKKSEFSQTADALATGGGRALGGIISKLHSLKNNYMEGSGSATIK